MISYSRCLYQNCAQVKFSEESVDFLRLEELGSVTHSADTNGSSVLADPKRGQKPPNLSLFSAYRSRHIDIQYLFF